jgi:hypothetical protein
MRQGAREPGARAAHSARANYATGSWLRRLGAWARQRRPCRQKALDSEAKPAAGTLDNPFPGRRPPDSMSRNRPCRVSAIMSIRCITLPAPGIAKIGKEDPPITAGQSA